MKCPELPTVTRSVVSDDSNTTVPLSGTSLPGRGPPDIRKSPDTSTVLASLPVAGSAARDCASLLEPDVQPARDSTTAAVKINAFILMRRSIGPRRSLVVGTTGGWNAGPAPRHPNKVTSQPTWRASHEHENFNETI